MSPTITNVRLGRLGLSAADCAWGLSPEAVAHLERCAQAVTVRTTHPGGAGRSHAPGIAPRGVVLAGPRETGALL